MKECTECQYEFEDTGQKKCPNPDCEKDLIDWSKRRWWIKIKRDQYVERKY